MLASSENSSDNENEGDNDKEENTQNSDLNNLENLKPENSRLNWVDTKNENKKLVTEEYFPHDFENAVLKSKN